MTAIAIVLGFVVLYGMITDRPWAAGLLLFLVCLLSSMPGPGSDDGDY